MKDDNCIFCKLANGDIPTNSIYEDDDFKVILDASPATKGTEQWRGGRPDGIPFPYAPDSKI